jgi:flavin reductase (DIM6/NTAB) family NADH-FMN oxidoreductase RutF
MQNSYIRGSVVESPVGLVVVQAGSRLNAMTVSFFSEAAHHPTTLWVSIERSTYTHSLLEESGYFSLVVLNSKQGNIAVSCGSVSGRNKDKCADLDLYESRSGFVFLKGALACTACHVSKTLTVGEHTLFLADILEGDVDSGASVLRHLLLSDLK